MSKIQLLEDIKGMQTSLGPIDVLVQVHWASLFSTVDFPDFSLFVMVTSKFTSCFEDLAHHSSVESRRNVRGLRRVGIGERIKVRISHDLPRHRLWFLVILVLPIALVHFVIRTAN